MWDFLLKYQDKLIHASLEHLNIVILSLTLSLLIAVMITFISMYSKLFTKVILNLFTVIYSIPSLALFALFIPVSGLGLGTAVIVLTIYNQYLLLNNFINGLNSVDSGVIDAATGIGMTKFQILMQVRLPLSKKALIAGIRIATVSTIGIATIAASINAGGLGTILFDGLRTMNINKIVWGSALSAGLAFLVNGVLSYIEGSLVISEIRKEP